MPVDLDDRGQALEDEYFYRQEKELLAKMKAKLDAELKAENAKTTALDCPRCKEKLVEAKMEGVTIDACGKCGGVWLDGGELHEILKNDNDKSSWISSLFG